MRIKNILPAVISLLFLSASIVYVSGYPVSDSVSNKTDETFETVKPDREIRGVWVTYMTLDVENEADKRSAFESKIDSIIEDMQRADLNTMIVQVRPFSDALYPSRYYPWSHIISGTQGQDPGFDPLGYIVDAAHENDIMVHAWINPYRISTQNTPAQLSADHPYRRDNSIGVEINGCQYMDPASEKARELIVSGAAEIARNYDIDGIQFDDYFYPPDCGDFDSESYTAYSSSTDDPLSLEEYRKNNVNELIKAVYQAVHHEKENILFGISPQGNLGNNEGLYADVETWCAEEGYIDYICPQIYFSLDNPALTYEDALADWMELSKHKSLSLYIGLAAYKAGTDADEGTWLDNDDILTREIKIAGDNKADGFMLYSYDSFHNEENAAEMDNVIDYLTSSPTQ